MAQMKTPGAAPSRRSTRAKAKGNGRAERTLQQAAASAHPDRSAADGENNN